MLTNSLKKATKYISDSQYRQQVTRKLQLKKVFKIPRYTQFSWDVLGHSLTIIDSHSFYHSYQEIFFQEVYAFTTNNPTPVIIDAGSNIGLSVIYFKQKYPDAKITAFEADPSIFQVLKYNLEKFSYSDIELINKALWNSEEGIKFVEDQADAGRIASLEENPPDTIITIPSVRLYDYLKNQTVDFLKMDIEGAETEVLLDCQDVLTNVNNMFIEYHSFYKKEQTLDQILSIIKEAGFRFQIKTGMISPSPFLERTVRKGKDSLLNIFCYREN